MIKPIHVLNKAIKVSARSAMALPGTAERVPAALMAARIARNCRVMYEPTRPDALNVLLFSVFRFTQDIDVLSQTGDLRLIEAPIETLQVVNGFFRTAPVVTDPDGYAYYREENPEFLAEREAQRRFIVEVVQALMKRMRIDCVLIPAVHYRFAFNWAEAFDSLGVPFIALHKEFTVIDRRHIPERVETYLADAFRFTGSWIFATNESARDLFTKGQVFDPERITITGLPRMDRLFREDSAWRKRTSTRKQVTLFSFAHYCGGLGVTRPRRSKYFSKHDDEGFVALFREVHAAFGELALAHPDAEFLIKPRDVAPYWIREIEQVLQSELGRGLDDIPNCRIEDRIAPELIRDSGRGDRLQLDRLARILGARAADHCAALRRGHR